MESGRLRGKVALVTGSASGIGRAVTGRFVADGATVVAADIDAASLVGMSGDASVLPVVCDVTDESSVKAAVDVAVDRFGGLDVVVASAGRGAYSPIAEHDVATWREIVDLCLTGVFLTIRASAQVLRDGGSIVTISSLNAIQPAEGMAAYCAAKAGVVQLTRVAAMELGRRGIRANAIGPGLVDTPLAQSLFALPGVVDEFIENTTLGRYAHPDEIAAFASFLASDESSFVTGSFHSIDGGGSTKRYPDIPGALARLGVA